MTRNLIDIKRSCYKSLLLVVLFCFCLGGTVHAQQRPHFNPERFEANLENFVVQQAGLNNQETTQFLPIYKEMRKQQVALMEQKRLLKNHNDPATLIRKRDQIDLKIKKLQMQYHERFLKVLPAEKVLKVIHAEEVFHRQAFSRHKK